MGDYLRANAIESSMKITGKLILGACLALILISLAAAIILPIAIVFFELYNTNYIFYWVHRRDFHFNEQLKSLK